jgi:dihydrofolate reductase
LSARPVAEPGGARPEIVIIAAVARNGVIGADNRLIWRLKSDMRHFRALTMGMPMIIGRKTFCSIGKPLPGRHTIVLTRDPAWHADGVDVAHSPQSALALAHQRAREHAASRIMIAGGAEIYALFEPIADRLELTEVELEPEGDAVFPPLDRTLWREENRRPFPKNADDEAPFAFVSYARR